MVHAPSRSSAEPGSPPSGIGAIERALVLSAEERTAIAALEGQRPLAVTPRFLALMDRDDPSDPLRRQVIPTPAELTRSKGEDVDPLAELEHEVAPGLIHRYPDRALLLVTGECAAYCRFCTRARLAGAPAPALEAAFEYLARHEEVREVIVSGGDPLVLDDARLEVILSRLRALPHVEVLRLGTRAPVFSPARITSALTRILARAAPLFVLVHVNHPRELDHDCVAALGRLADAGLPLLSQTVLLRGINDDTETLAGLFRGLLRARVHPYYLHQCDLAAGTAAFRVPIARGLELIETLRDSMSGLAVPHYAVDLPAAGGKVTLLPERILERRPQGLSIRGVGGRAVWVPSALTGSGDGT